MPEFAALIETVNNNVTKLEEELGQTQEQLVLIVEKLDRLPEHYLPRPEAEDKADRVKKALAGLMVGVIVIIGLGFYFKAEATQACKDSREGLREVIVVAVADRQPLATSTPETIAAIEQVNATQIRPLREKLLSLDGTQPSKC